MAQFRGLLLLGIALALTGCQPSSPSAGASAARFEAHLVQSGDGPAVVRFDTATGALQKASLVGTRNWTPLGGAVLVSGPAGRFAFNFAQTKAIPLTFIRLDTQTGDVWRMAYPRDPDWVAFRSRDEKAPAAGAAAAAPAQRREPRASVAANPPPVEPAAAPAALPKPGQADEDIPAYVKGIESENLPAEMRAWAVEQLGNVKSKQAVPPLIAVLADEDPMVLRSAIRALAKHDDDPRVKPALEKMTTHALPEIARVAQLTLDALR